MSATPSLRRIDRLLLMWWAQGPDGASPSAQAWVADRFEQIEALREAGLLSADTAATWQRRFQLAAADTGDQLDELAPDVRALLHEARDAVPRQAAAAGLEARRFAAISSALQALGALDSREFQEVSMQVYGRLTHSAPAPEPDAEIEERLRRHRLASTATSNEIVAVLPGPPHRRSGLQIVSVELWADWAAVCWNLATNQSGPPRPAGPPTESMLTISDDTGTVYLALPNGCTLIGHAPDGDPKPRIYRGSERFLPVPPPHARRLLITFDEARFELPLPSSATE